MPMIVQQSSRRMRPVLDRTFPSTGPARHWLLSLALVMLGAVLATPLPLLAQQHHSEFLPEGGHGFARDWIDVNNDGRDDFCMFIGGAAETVRCHLSNGAGLEQTSTEFQVGGYGLGFHQWTDVNGDGRVDLCRLMDKVSAYAQVGITLQCRLGPSLTSSITTMVPVYTQTAPAPGEPPDPLNTGIERESDLFLVDIDADARTDLCYLYRHASGKGLRCQRSLGTSFAGSTSTWTRTSVVLPAEGWPAGFFDFNGDGAVDFCRVGTDGRLRCLTGSLSGISTATDVVSSIMPANAGVAKEGAAWVDVNADGKVDFCGVRLYELACLLTTGVQWESSFRLSDYTSSSTLWGHPHARWWVDINGDGFPDFCRAMGPSPVQNDGSQNGYSNLWCRLGQGGDAQASGLFGFDDVKVGANLSTWAVNFGLANGGRAFCDPWGNGILTLCRVTFQEVPTGSACDPFTGVCSPTYRAQYGVWMGLTGGTQALPGLLSAFSDGVGAETRISYLPLSDSAIYRRSGFGTFESPRAQIIAPRSFAVFETRAWRPNSSVTLTGSARYAYGDLTIDRLSGMRGFRHRWMLNEGSNVVEQVTFYQGLGASIDPGSIMDDALEIGQVREKRRYMVRASDVVVPATSGLNPRQQRLAVIMEKAMQSNVTATSTSGVQSPFILVERTVNTLASALADNPRFRPVGSSRIEKWDWTGSVKIELPVIDVQSTFNKYGDAELIKQSTQVKNASNQFVEWSTKTTTNIYDLTRVDEWILGRLRRSEVVSKAPSAETQINQHPVSKGTAASLDQTAADAPTARSLAVPADHASFKLHQEGD